MKRILVISEEDMTAVKLTELYHTIYGHMSKELYMCTVAFSNCKIGHVETPLHRANKTAIISNAPNPMRDYFVQSKPHLRVTAKNCSEIINIIKSNGIDTILVPHFLYDQARLDLFNNIVKEIRQTHNIDIIGLYV